MKVIGKGERLLMYEFAIVVDIVQIILDFFVVTEPINHLIDIIVGVIILLYARVRGLLTMNKGLVLLAYFSAEQIPFINAFPFWTLDIKNIYSGVPSSEVELDNIIKSNKEKSGTTPPRLPRRPVNATPGVRPPRFPR